MPALPAPSAHLSLREARRIALAASLLGGRRPKRRGPAALAGMFGRLGMVQMDSVSVLARAHYMPGFARLGRHEAALLDRAAYGPGRTLFEYWGHEASLIRLDLQPSLRWRMAEARAGTGLYGGLRRFAAERGGFIDAVLREVEARGPLSARDLGGSGRPGGGWWEWSDGKRVLEWLFWAGLVTTHSRRGFERVYDVTERALPQAAALPTPPPEEAKRALLSVAAGALGVATARDLAAYWRLRPQDAAPRLAELVEEGALAPVTVGTWRQPAYLVTNAPPPKRPSGARLVSPFDPLLWERERAERLFGFRYRNEIYTPAEKREHGYYVLPLLLGDRFAARLDLKADRPGRRLVVAAAHREPGAAEDEAAGAAAAELQELAAWLGLSAIIVEPRGDLAAALKARLG